MRIVLTIVSICIATVLYAQQESADVRRGNRQYNDSSYIEAEVNYRRGLEKNENSFEGHYNLGNALFRQGKYEQAGEQYLAAARIAAGDRSLGEAEMDERLSASYHNLGNAYYAQQEYTKAIEAYKEALRHNPKDDYTRYNLVKAMQQSKPIVPQPQPQSQQDSTQQQDSIQQPPQPQPQEPDNQMDKETAEQILQALEQDEQELLEEQKRQGKGKRRLEKNW